MTKKVFIFFISCLLLSLTGCGKYGSIEFQGVTYEKRIFSDDVIHWIEKYNSLSEEQKSYISYIPAELKSKIKTDDTMTIEVTNQLVGKVYKIKDNIVYIGQSMIYECEVSDEVLNKVKLGDIVEIEYNTYRDEEFKITPTAVTVVQRGIDVVGSYVEMLNYIWEKSDEMNKDVKEILLDLSNTVNLTDYEKEIVSKYFQEIVNCKMNHMFVKGSILNEDAMKEWSKTGLILRIDEVIKTETGFNFTISKIREGYDTITIPNCKIDKLEDETVLIYEDTVLENIQDIDEVEDLNIVNNIENEESVVEGMVDLDVIEHKIEDVRTETTTPSEISQ